MTDHDQPGAQTGGTPRAADEGVATHGVDQLAAHLLGASTTDEPRQDQARPAADGTPKDLPEEIEVPWKGATRRVKTKDLVAQAQKAEEAEQRSQLLSQEMQKHAAGAAFVKHLESLPQEDQEAFKAVLANPKLARQLVQRKSPESDEVSDEEIDELVAPSGKKSASPQSARLDQMEQVLCTLAAHVQGDMQQKLQQSTSQKVEELMKAYPVFEENEAGAKFAKRSIFSRIASQKDANLEDVIAEHAAGLHEMLQQERQSFTQQVRPTGRPSLRPLPSPDRAPTGAELESGELGKQLLARFRG